jgi:hypothetical protein
MNTITPHIGCTAEELARRAEIAELRQKIREEAAYRRMIKEAYRLPHGSPENQAAMAAARITLGLTKHVYSWNAHAIPSRDHGRGYVTQLHIELAELRGKVHLTPRKL